MDPLALYGNAKDVIEIVRSFKDRCIAIRQNLPSVTLLIESYQNLAERLKSMSESHHATIARFSVHDADSIQKRLRELKTTFSSANKQLRTEFTRLEKRGLYRILRAKHTEKLFSALQQDANRAMEKLDGIQDTLTISSLILCRQSTDCFRHCNTAPPNETNIVLDFETIDDNGVPLTCEGRLKAAILRSADGQSVGAVASGMGGVGKTCALRALAYDPDIVKRFPDAICFISLGLDATVASLMESLCFLVEVAGGKKLAEELRQETDLHTMIEKVRSWFFGYICLFMVDDVWCSTSTARGIKRDILGKLSILASRSGSQGGSRLVYSTRDDSLSSMGEVVLFEPRYPRGTTSTDILLQCAGAGEDELRDPICKEVIRNILDYCAGLPVALNISGRTVRWKKGKWKGEQKETWIAYWNELKKYGILDADTLSNNYRKIGCSLGASLDFLDQDNLRSILGMSFREVHRALCVMQKQDWISSGVLRTLCGIRDDELSKKAIEAMGKVGVVDEEHRLVDGEESVGLRLHDLVLDFARHEAEKSGEVATWHAKLIDNTLTETDVSGDDACWPVLLPEDSYVFRSICRLLKEAGRREGMWSLLLSAEWIVKMARTGCVRRLDEDIALCTSSNCDSDKAKSLRMVGNAVRLSTPYTADAPEVVWFQLFARLLESSKGSEVIRGFLEKVEEIAPKPWLRPTKTCIKRFSEALVDTFVIDGIAEDVGFMEDNVVCCYTKASRESGVDLRYCDFGIRKVCSDGARLDLVCRGDSVRDVWLFNRSSRIFRSEDMHGMTRSSGAESGSSILPQITLVAIGRDGRYAVTANSLGLVRIWNISTLMPQGEPNTVHKDHVRCVAMSSGCKRAVSCSRSSVRVWNGETGKQEGFEFSGGGSLVSISENGKWIVAATGFWLSVWDGESRNCICSTKSNLLNRFGMVSIRGDGKKVVGTMGDSLTIVDVENAQIEQDLGQMNYEMSCIDMSCDGSLVVSGSSDGKVRIYDVEAGRQVAKFEGHKDTVRAISIQNDKKRVVSVSEDGTVCVWNPEIFGEASILPDGHKHAVHFVAVCADGRFVASQDDSDMLLCSVDSGKPLLWAPPIPRWQIRVVSATRRGDRIVSGSKFGRVRVWENKNARMWRWPPEMEEHSYREHYFANNSVGIPQVDIRSGNMVVSIDEGNNVRLWNSNDKSPVLTAIPVPQETVCSVGIIRRNYQEPTVALGLKGGNILLSDDGKDLFEDPLVGHTDEVSTLFFRSNILVSGSRDKSIIIWNWRTRQVIQKLFGHTSGVCTLAISHSAAYLVSGSDDRTVRVWGPKKMRREDILIGAQTPTAFQNRISTALQNMEQKYTLTGQAGSVCCVGINATHVVSSSNGNNGNTVVRVWDFRKGTAIHFLPQVSIMDVRFSKNGQEIMCVSKDKYRIVQWWDVESGKRMGYEFGGHMGEIQKLGIDPDGILMAVLSSPTQEYKHWNPKGVLDLPQVLVWDLENMRCVYVGAEDEWDKITCGFVIDEIKADEVESQKNIEFRVGENRRSIVYGERILANSESNICSFDVEYKNKVVVAGHSRGEVAIFKIV